MIKHPLTQRLAGFAPALFAAVLGAGALALTPAAQAEEATPDLGKLKSVLRGIEPDSVQPTPINGLYEVVIGSQVLYLSGDGNYAIQGEVIDLNGARNLTEARLQSLRAERLATLDPADMIVFSPAGEVQHAVTVFTDIDCGYCRKLHQEMETYLERGIEVRYLAFPRAGLQSDSYNKAVSAWCADDRQQALTTAKLGKEIPAKSCDNPVGEQYSLGQQLGVQGTPSIFLSNGDMVPGYVPADRLEQMLAQRGQ